MKKLLKQLICFVLIFIAAFSCFGNSDIIDDIMIIASAATTASGTCGENVTWSFDADTATLTISGSGNMFDYTNANLPWYKFMSDIITVIINDGVTSIGDYAFFPCEALISITIPGSVTRFGNKAFTWCELLTNVYYKGNLTGWCEIDASDNILRYANNLYINGTLVEGDIIIPKGTNMIGNYCFYSLENITSVTIPDSVKSINKNAFDSCDNLTSVTIGDGVTIIDDSAFVNCSNLSSVIMGNNVQRIGYSAFNRCNNLINITLPPSLTTIDDYSFYRCGISEISIPKDVTYIGHNAFNGCSELADITISANKVCIGQSAFYNTSLWADESKWENNALYIGCHLIEVKSDVLGAYEIKNGTKSIAGDAFALCEDITEIYIPNGVVSIGFGAFQSCKSIVELTIPESVEMIDESAFYNCINLDTFNFNAVNCKNMGSYDRPVFSYCSNLTKVNIGNTVKNIPDYSFYETGISSIVIPKSVTNIGYKAFYYTNMYNEDSNWENDAFYIDDCLIEVKTLNKGEYSIKEGTRVIADSAFTWSSDLNGIIIPDSVTNIDDEAFQYCSDLSFFDVDERNSCYSNDDYGVLFDNNKSKIIRYPLGNNKTEYIIPESVIGLERNAFDNCSKLTQIFIPKEITSIPYRSFYNCSLLTDVYYTGSESEWLALPIEENNDSLLNATIHYNSQVYDVCYDANGGELNVISDQQKIGTVDTQLTSVLPEKSFNITFDANGGQVQTSKKTFDCTFESWNTAQDGNGKSYQPGSTYTADEDVTLYAQWDNPEIGTLEIPTRDGYYFEGWYTDPYEGTKVSETSVVSSDLTLYAHWNKLEVTGLKWVTKPAKTEYFVGESLNTEGAEITATFNSGETKTIPLDEIEFYPTDFDRAGKKIVKATYGEKYVSFIVNVKNINLTSVSVEKMPQKLVYTVGDKLDTSGLVLKVVYDDSSTKTITEDFSVSCDIASSGTKAVTVNYTENGVTVSTSYQITVNPKVTEPDAVISADSVSVAAGEIISVPFRVENNKGFMGFAITVDYDSDAFTPVSVTPGVMLGNGTLNDSIGSAAYEHLKIVYVGSEDVKTNGDLFTVSFLANKNASGNYTFDVSCLQPDTFNESLDDVVLKCNDFDVSVSNQAVEQSVIFVGGSVDATAGTTVTVPVSVENGVGINSFVFKMGYNSEFMSVVKATNGAVLSNGTINVTVDESSEEITLTWSGSPITANGELFYVTFEIDEFIQANEILALSCENVKYANGSEKDIICTDAEVNISNPNGGNTPIIYSKDYLRIEDSIIEVPVYIKNNHGVMGFGMNFEYDSSVITPLSVTAGNLLSAGYFVNNAGAKDGSFKVLWNHTENIYGNGLLFTLKFSVAKGAKPESVPLSITYSQPDTYNEKWEDVTLNTNISEIGISYIYTATFMHNGEVIGTDEFFADDESLDYPSMPERVGYKWEWDEHGIVAEDITVEGRYIPIEYTISYYNGDVLVATDKFTVETDKDNILLPEVPEKEGYAGEWESFELGTSDIRVNCIYTPIVYTATFMHNGETIGTDKFTVEDSELDLPETEPKEHYVWKWDEYVISAADLSVEGRYVPVEYTVNFVSGGQTVKTQKYTVETLDSISAPEFSLPAKEGYYSEWESWEGKVGNLTVNEIYVAREYTVSFLCDGQIISQGKFTVETKAEEIKLPEIPEKTGYTGQWNEFVIAAKDIEVKCIYTPVVYTATFMSDGKVIGTDTFTVEDDSLDYPYIVKWAYYDWIWDEHKIEAENLTIEGRYVPITYTVTFVSGGKVIKTQKYNINTVDSIVAPAKSLPAKQHYTTAWEDWSGKVGNITVNEIYVPIKYKISFYCQDKLVATRLYTIETSENHIIVPNVPKVDGYDVKWPEIKLAYKDQSIYATCTPIVYKAQFVADGRVVATRTFTVETESLNEPAVPQKAGYIAVWGSYTIKARDITVYAKYYSPEVAMKAKATLKTDETLRLLPSCNFEVTGKSWISSNPAVATVDNHGNVTAVGKGECKITVICYGKDSFGNEIKATEKTEITVKEQLSAETLKERFRTAFDEFFQVKLYDFLFNFKKFMIILFRYAY